METTKEIIYTLKEVAFGDLIIERSSTLYFFPDGLKVFEASVGDKVIEDMEAFNSFCEQNHTKIVRLTFDIKIKRREGPLNEIIFPWVFRSFDEANIFLNEKADTIAPENADEFMLSLIFPDRLCATFLNRFTQEMLKGKDEDYTGLLPLFVEEIDYCAKKSWLERERAAMKKVRFRLEAMGIIEKVEEEILEKKAA